MPKLVLLLLALAIPLSAATTTNLTLCAYSGPGPGPISCEFSGISVVPIGVTRIFERAEIIGDTISLVAISQGATSSSAGGSITHDDFFRVDNGISQVFGVFSFVCGLDSTVGANTKVRYAVGSQSSPVDFCLFQDRKQTLTQPFSVNDGIVEVTSRLEGSVSTADYSSRLITTLSLVGLTDARGNPVAATVVPEPGTFGVLLVALAGLALKKRSSSRFTG